MILWVGTCLLVWGTHGYAAAAVCDSVIGDSGDNIVILGSQTTHVGTYPNDFYVSLSPLRLQACWRDQYGLWHLDTTSCTGTYTPAGDQVIVDTGEGDDIVVAHPDSAGNFTCPVSTGVVVGPWVPGMDFGINALLGTGADTAYLSPNDDIAISGAATAVDDGANDIMCGYGGDDILLGDGTDGTDLECLDGGADTDVCYGYGSDVSPDPDSAPRCETVNSASSGCSYIPPFLFLCDSCAGGGVFGLSSYCGSEPPDLSPI